MNDKHPTTKPETVDEILDRVFKRISTEMSDAVDRFWRQNFKERTEQMRQRTKAK